MSASQIMTYSEREVVRRSWVRIPEFPSDRALSLERIFLLDETSVSSARKVQDLGMFLNNDGKLDRFA